MTTGIKCVGGKMDATRTYSARWWKWIAAPALSCDGFLILGQVVEKSGEVDESVYGVQEVPCAFPGGRAFCVRKLGAAVGSEEEQYTTQVFPRASACTCTAGRTRTEVCRHRDGIAAAIAAGALPAVQPIGA